MVARHNTDVSRTGDHSGCWALTNENLVLPLYSQTDRLICRTGAGPGESTCRVVKKPTHPQNQQRGCPVTAGQAVAVSRSGRDPGSTYPEERPSETGEDRQWAEPKGPDWFIYVMFCSNSQCYTLSHHAGRLFIPQSVDIVCGEKKCLKQSFPK